MISKWAFSRTQCYTWFLRAPSCATPPLRFSAMTKKKLEPIELYAQQMRDIKRRTEVIDFFLYNGGHALYQAATLESICLQIRKILELIAFSSLIANKNRYAEAYSNFASHWKAENLLRDLARVNPDFYPKPIQEKSSAIPGVVNDLVPVADGFMTEDDFVKIYKKCGAMMHASNPYGSTTSQIFYKKSIPIWRAKIVKLLNCHQVNLFGETNFWLFHMKEDRGDDVYFYNFGLVAE